MTLIQAEPTALERTIDCKRLAPDGRRFIKPDLAQEAHQKEARNVGSHKERITES